MFQALITVFAPDAGQPKVAICTPLNVSRFSLIQRLSGVSLVETHHKKVTGEKRRDNEAS
jgi:hypothetical protein